MSNDWIESYIRAGKAVIAAKKVAVKLIKPGVQFLEIANKCEEEILNQGCELSFPINMSLDEIAAHYSPPIDDSTIIPINGLLKIDIGSHYDGYIADSAITFNLDNDETLQNVIDAAQEALEAAIEIFKPGTKLYELGDVIAKAIKNRGLEPIYNLGGHELKRYTLHAGPFIPNYKAISHNQILKPGDAYACEPFATSGKGIVENGTKSYIYRFNKAKKGLPFIEKNYMDQINKLTKKLPFSPRLLEKHNTIPKNKIQRIIDVFVRKKILDHYPLLIEKTKKPVAQQEHTIIIDMDGNPIVTT
jgi:methionyl aminopeptidase